MKGQFHKLENNKRNNRESRPRFMGYVTNWNSEKGYGFIRCYEDGESYYCSQKVINGEPYLRKGTIVSVFIGHGKDREENPSTYIADLLVVEVPEERHNKY